LPSSDFEIEVGQPATISFNAGDADDTGVLVNLESVRDDGTRSNGNFSESFPQFINFASEDSNNVRKDVIWTPQEPGVYGFAATADDLTGLLDHDVNNNAVGRITVLAEGTGGSNSPPTLDVLAPIRDRNLLNDDLVGIVCNYTNIERNDSLTLSLVLDTDNDPQNDDMDPNVLQIEQRTLESSFDVDDDGITPIPVELDTDFDGFRDTYAPGDLFPAYVNGNIVAMYDTDDDTFFDVEGAFTFIWKVDTAQVPSLKDANGDPLPYFLRVDADDGTTKTSRYAVGRMFVPRAAGANQIIDVAEIGFGIAGTRFQGFSTNDYLGTSFIGMGRIVSADPNSIVNDETNCTVPPFDNADEFVMVAKYGTPRNRGNVGAAYLVYGQESTPTGGRFASTVTITSIGVTTPGMTFGSTSGHFQVPRPNRPTLNPERDVLARGLNNASLDPQPLHAPGGTRTLGLSSVARLDDVTDDGIPELVFGFPYISGLWDLMDIDPCDCPQQGDNSDDCGENSMCTYRFGAPDQFPEDIFTDPDQASCGPPQDEDDYESHDQGYVIVEAEYCNSGGISNFIDLRFSGQRGTFSNGFPSRSDDEGVLIGEDHGTRGARFSGGTFDEARITNEWGRTVTSARGLLNTVPDPFGKLRDNLVISAPGAFLGSGQVTIVLNSDFTAPGGGGDDGTGNISFPRVEVRGQCSCNQMENCMNVRETRGFLSRRINGPSGVRLGWAGAAGDFNADLLNDIVCGAPQAPAPGGVGLAGRVYVVYNQSGGYGNIDLILGDPANPDLGVPRLELYGTSVLDRFGFVQGEVGDVNGDNKVDTLIASGSFDDGPNVDAGFVGIVFASERFQGTPRLILPVTDIATTAQLEGIQFIGKPGSRAGHAAAGAGDFDGDGLEDILIAAPEERRMVSGELRRGVVYLIYGDLALTNQVIHLEDVGVTLDGIVFVSPVADNDPIDTDATLESVAGIGDVDGDGFDDIIIGAPRVDFVDPAGSGQRQRNSGQAFLIYGNNSGRTNPQP
ncbi:MAG: FG-GAP repeat protein, partial [Phycisphaerae bacterium]